MLAYDFDGTQANLVTFSTPNTFNNVKTGELQFISNETTWLHDWVKWVAGFYYYKSDGGYDPLDIRVAGTPGLNPSGLLFGLIPPVNTQQILNGILPSSITPLTGPGVDVLVDGVLETHSYSAFTQETVSITDRLDLILGGRWQKENRYLIQQHNDLENPLNQFDGSPVTSGETLLFSFSQPKQYEYNFSPKISLSYKFGDDSLVYATWSKGFKSGSYNIAFVYTAPQYVKPERARSFEIGSKFNLLDRNLHVNAALFTETITNKQEQYVSLQNGGAVSVQNAASARSRGVEADLQWIALPVLDPDLLVSASATYLDASYLSFPGAAGFDPTTGLFSTAFDFTGHQISETAKWTANTGLGQTFHGRWGTTEARVDGYYRSGIYFTAQNASFAQQAAYFTLGAGIGQFYEPWKVRLSLFGANLTGTRYQIGAIPLDFGVLSTLAPPRTFGVSVKWEY